MVCRVVNVCHVETWIDGGVSNGGASHGHTQFAWGVPQGAVPLKEQSEREEREAIEAKLLVIRERKAMRERESEEKEREEAERDAGEEREKVPPIILMGSLTILEGGGTTGNTP